MEELTESIKYVFLDIVDYTKRSVEAQSDIVSILNDIIKKSVKDKGIDLNDEGKDEYSFDEEVIFIPAGDGICIAIRNHLTYDIHILIALDILLNIQRYNEDQEDTQRKFNVRMGVNENTDNIIEDINGRTNVAGSGVNIASRIMDNADGNQILISESVYNILYARENYMDSFRRYEATIKHEKKIPVYQYIKEGHEGLNINVPSNLSDKKKSYKLSKEIAYYFAIAVTNEKLLIEKTGGDSASYTPIILLWLLAKDFHETSKSRYFETPYLNFTKKEILFIEKIYDKIEETMIPILSHYSESIIDHYLEKYYGNYFEDDRFGTKCWFMINESGRNKLKKEYPDIWDEFALDDIQ